MPERAPRTPLPDNGPPRDLCYSIKDLHRVTGWCRDTIYDLIRKQKIESFLIGSRRYVSTASVRAFIASRVAQPLSLLKPPSKPKATGRSDGGRGGARTPSRRKARADAGETAP